MPSDIKDDLSPSDGLSNVWIDLDGIQYHGSKRSDVSFRVFRRSTDGSDQFIAALSFPVHGSNEFYETVSLAHDELIAFLRQALYVSNILRQSYRKSAEHMIQRVS
jgi:hypothetical protein